MLKFYHFLYLAEYSAEVFVRQLSFFRRFVRKKFSSMDRHVPFSQPIMLDAMNSAFESLCCYLKKVKGFKLDAFESFDGQTYEKMPFELFVEYAGLVFRSPHVDDKFFYTHLFLVMDYSKKGYIAVPQFCYLGIISTVQMDVLM